MNWLTGIVLGFVSGISSILPISQEAHDSLFRILLGASAPDPVHALLLDAAVLLALYTGCRRLFRTVARERSASSGRKGLLQRQLSTSVTTMLLAMVLFTVFTDPLSGSLLQIAVMLLLNGILLYLPSRLPRGNKDFRNFSPLDSVCVGLGAGIGGLAGLSGMAGSLSVAQIRGADKQYTLLLSLMLCVVSRCFTLVLDVFHLAAGAALQPAMLLQYIVSAAVCFAGGRAAIAALRYLAVRVGFAGFAYYCWGAGLLSFILYLSI